MMLKLGNKRVKRIFEARIIQSNDVESIFKEIKQRQIVANSK